MQRAVSGPPVQVVGGLFFFFCSYLFQLCAAWSCGLFIIVLKGIQASWTAIKKKLWKKEELNFMYCEHIHEYEKFGFFLRFIFFKSLTTQRTPDQKWQRKKTFFM
jgi:hypothetical protein